MTTPDWWETTLLALAAFRVWRLLAEDDVLDRPRRWLLRLGDWRKEGDPVPPGYRAAAGKFLACPWCLGFWVSVAWWSVWLADAGVATWAAAPFAISAAVGLVRTNLDSGE